MGARGDSRGRGEVGFIFQLLAPRSRMALEFSDVLLRKAAGAEPAASSIIQGVTLSTLHVQADEIEGVALSGAWMQCKRVRGLAIGSYLSAEESMTGLAVGILNHTSDLRGVQLGVLNIVEENPLPFRYLPLLNLRF